MAATDAPDLPDLPLAADFDAAGDDAWRAEVDKVLAKGKGDLDADALRALFEKTLVTSTVDGLRIEPLYTGGETMRPTAAGVPGRPPFVRGARPAGAWDVRQWVLVPADVSASGAGLPASGASVSVASVAEQIRHELERGATSIVLDVRDLVAAGTAVTVDLLDALLDGVLLDLVTIELESGDDWREATSALLDLYERRGVGEGERRAVLGVDPLTRWATTGGSTDLDAELHELRTLAQRAGSAGDIRAVAVAGALAHECGGGDVEELGWSIAAGVAYLRALTSDEALDVDAAARQLEFVYAATPDQFLTIAKLRAARLLWQRVCDVAGASADAQRQRQHAVTSTAAATRYDTWTNLLRSTIECFAAGVGGADSVTVLPHDHLVIPGGSAVGRRMARNTQLVLLEESNLARVADMPGGSWYVEDLTAQLAEAGWAFFQEIERTGGAIEAVRSGLVQRRVADVRARRDAAIAKRRHPLTGLSEFPDIGETPPPRAATANTGTGGPTVSPTFEPLTSVRHAQAFEEQRARADEIERRTQRRPEVFLVNLGRPAVHTTRATFAKNVFEVAGIRAVSGDDAGYDTPEAAAAAVAASGAELACICSDDKLYADLAIPVAEAIAALPADQRPERLYLAGRPAGLDAALASAGVDEQLFAGMDVLDLLTRALDAIENTATAAPTSDTGDEGNAR